MYWVKLCIQCLYVIVCSHLFTCAWEGSTGAFSIDSLLKHSVESGADGWHVWPEFPRLHHDRRIHTPLPPSFAIDSCTFNKSTEIQLLARFYSKPHQLSHTGNCLSQCKGGNWIAGLWGKMYTHCSCVHLIMLWIVGRLHNGRLEAYASSTGYSLD